MGSRRFRVVVISTQEPGIVGQGRKRFVSRESDAEVSQLHAGLAPVTRKQFEVPVCLSMDVADDYQQLLLARAPISQGCDTQIRDISSCLYM
jgi:hypothetical protein